MKFYVILIALHLLAAAYIECNSNVTRKEVHRSSEANGSKRSAHNRAHIQGNKNWELDNKYRYMVMILWQFRAQTMTILSEDEIGVIKNQELYYKCSGVVIDAFHVVTAASCFQPSIRQSGNTQGNFLFSPTGGLVKSQFQNRTISTVYIHPDYIENSHKGDVDIALVQVTQSFNTGNLQSAHELVTVARIGQNFAYSPTVNENYMMDCMILNYGEDAATAEPPFYQQLTLTDVRAAGPKYCEILYRNLREPWYNHENPMHPAAQPEDDMFDSYFVCATPSEWYGGRRPVLWEKGLGCFGAVGGALTCQNADIVVGIQSQRFDTEYCEDENSFSTFTNLADPKVNNWIKKYVWSLGASVNDMDGSYLYNVRGLETPIDDNVASDTSSTAMVSTCGGLILRLALSIMAFTF